MAELINSGKIIHKPEIVVDPSLFLPGGIIGARSKRGDEVRNPDDSYVSGLGAAGSGDDFPGDAGGEGGDEGPIRVPPPQYILPPTDFSIVSQTIKFSPDGNMVVDVVVEFNDIEGATGYDLRVTKGTDSVGEIIPTDPEEVQ